LSDKCLQLPATILRRETKANGNKKDAEVVIPKAKYTGMHSRLDGYVSKWSLKATKI